MADLSKLRQQTQTIFTPELLRAVYRLRFPHPPGGCPSGAIIGQWQFRPTEVYRQPFHDLVFHQALLPLSKLPLDSLLAFDLTTLLPAPNASDYPEQCLGMVILLNQTRLILAGYSFRYTVAFFDHVCEQPARRLVGFPPNIRPDGQQAWLSRGYNLDDWLVRTIWFWTPLVHSGTFMTADRQALKDWLHGMRAEVEAYAGHSDPFAPMEAEDDVNILAFQQIETAGPPTKSFRYPEDEATVADYAFWWIRILNAHFAITDMCGHYPYWWRWKGLEYTDKDREFMQKSNAFRYNPADEPALRQVREDYLAGVWRELQPNPKFEVDPVRQSRRRGLCIYAEACTFLAPWKSVTCNEYRYQRTSSHWVVLLVANIVYRDRRQQRYKAREELENASYSEVQLCLIERCADSFAID